MNKAKEKLQAYIRKPGSLILMLLVMLAAVMTFLVLFFLIAYILIKGVPHLKPDLFALHYTTDNVSLMPALLNTVIMTFFYQQSVQYRTPTMKGRLRLGQRKNAASSAS